MNKNFDYLGNTFQLQLLNQIVEDKKFSDSIMDVLESSYFDNKYFKIIVQMVKEYYVKYKSTPNFDILEQIIKSEISQELVLKIVLDTLNNVKSAPFEGSQFVQEKALKFCKQQELQKAMDRAQKIISEGDFESYDKVEGLVREALQVGVITKDETDIFNNLEEVLDEDFRHPIPIGIKGIDNLLKGGLAKGEIGVILAPTGVGKANPISEPILTPYGWTTMGKIKVGDKVIGSDGKEQFILGVYPQGLRPIYYVQFTDGTNSYCDEEHLWSVNTIEMRSSKKTKNSYKVLKTKELAKNIKVGSKYNYKLPIVKPVHFEYRNVNIDPYLMGVLLSDKVSKTNYEEIKLKDNGVIENIKSFYGDEIINTKTKKILKLSKKIKNDLSSYGLIEGNSYIPSDYLYNSLEIRIELLRGLMDACGKIKKSGKINIKTTSEELSNDIYELVLSLGGSVKFKISDGYSFKLKISLPNDIKPFNTLKKTSKYLKVKKPEIKKYIKSIDYSHDEEAVCIKVSNPDELYVTRDYILTHNTTILTKIANTAFNLGYNVLQIFFEDNPKIIQRKHFTIWTGIEPDKLVVNREKVMSKVNEIKNSMSNKLILKKLASDTVTMGQIKSQVRKLIADGIKIDLVVLDYIDCVLPERTSKDEWKAEGSTMRAFEAMCHELDLCGWLGTQGNRCCSLDTIVDIENKGVIEIKDVKDGDKILTHLGYKEITHIFPIQKQPVYKIKTKSGKEIKVSTKHKFPTHNGEIKSINEGLKVGDKFLIRKD